MCYRGTMHLAVVFALFIILLAFVQSKQSPGHENCFMKEEVDCLYFETLKREIHTAKLKIWVYWKIQKYPRFLTSLHIPAKSWDIQKAKFIKLILDKPSNGANQTFVAGFGGSSVTAGHDNYFYEAYPNVFYEAMLPVMKAIGHVDFQVRNRALGNNPCYPYDACTETHFGSDLDIVTWEQAFNCGRESKTQDTLARHADRMPKKPTVIYFHSGGKHWQAHECVNVTSSTPRPPESEEEKRLLHLIRQDNYRGIADSNKHAKVMPFMVDTPYAIPGVKHGQDITVIHSPEKFIVDRFEHLAVMAQEYSFYDAYKCYGPYGAHFCEKTPGGGGGWHPGKEQHKMRGDTLAYGMLSILEDAVQSIQDSVCVLSGDVMTVAGAKQPAHSSVGGGSAGDETKHRQLKEDNNEEVPKSLQVPSSRQSASQILKSHPKSQQQQQQIDDAAPKILHDSKTSIDSVDETKIAMMSNHTNFRQSALDILSHTHASVHKRPLAALTSGSSSHESTKSVAGGGVTTTKVIPPVNPRIPETAIELLNLPINQNSTSKPFALVSDTGSPCHYSQSADQASLRVAALRTVQQYTQYYLDSLYSSAKVIPVPEYYNASETNGPSTCYTDYEPRERRDLNLSARVVEKYSNWQLALSFFDVRAVADSIKLNRGYLDRKMLFSSNGTGSQIVLRVHNEALNFIWVCQCQKGILRYPAYMGDLIPNAEFYVLFNEANVDKLATGKQGDPNGDNSMMLDMAKFTRIDVEPWGAMCYRPNIKFPVGDHILVIRQKASDKKVNLGYVVTF